MLIGVVSDTHGRAESAIRAVRVLESFAPAAVLHCGDIGSQKVVEVFALWPTHYVLGNTDDESLPLAEAVVAAGGAWHDRFGDLVLAGRRIALLHGDDSRRLAQSIDSQNYDLVCSGHTHVPESRRHGKKLVLNPGALHRARDYTIAVVDLIEMRATHMVV